MGTTRKPRKPPLSTTPALDAEPPPPPEPERKIVKVERGKKKATTDEVIEQVVLALLRALPRTYSALLADPAVADMKVNEGRLAPIFAGLIKDKVVRANSAGEYVVIPIFCPTCSAPRTHDGIGGTLAYYCKCASAPAAPAVEGPAEVKTSTAYTRSQAIQEGHSVPCAETGVRHYCPICDPHGVARIGHRIFGLLRERPRSYSQLADCFGTAAERACVAALVTKFVDEGKLRDCDRMRHLEVVEEAPVESPAPAPYRSEDPGPPAEEAPEEEAPAEEEPVAPAAEEPATCGACGVTGRGVGDTHVEAECRELNRIREESAARDAASAAKRRDVSRARRRAAQPRDDVPAGVTPPIPAPVIVESQLDTRAPSPIEPTADELVDIDSHRFTFQGVRGAYATCGCGAQRDLVLRGQRTVRLYRESPAAPWLVAIPRCSRSRA